jgi:hypothetical protein
MVSYALRQLARVELITGEAPQEAPANKSMHLETRAARVFNEKPALVHTHRPAPLRTIRRTNFASKPVQRQAEGNSVRSNVRFQWKADLASSSAGCLDVNCRFDFYNQQLGAVSIRNDNPLAQPLNSIREVVRCDLCSRFDGRMASSRDVREVCSLFIINPVPVSFYVEEESCHKRHLMPVGLERLNGGYQPLSDALGC